MTNSSFPLSQKHIDFILTTNVKAEFLEGTTASGKTTVGAGVKFMNMVSASTKTQHVIAAKTVGMAEKNILKSDNGILKIHANARYYGNGDSEFKLPHVKFEGKVIFILGYDNKDKWENALGAQFGCVLIDEINTAGMEFVREISHRNDYLLATLNPDDPDLPIYEEFINRSRPFKKYENDVPPEIMEDLLRTEPTPGWKYWFFTFDDNLSLTEEEKQKKIDSVPKGSKMFKNKILGLRGRSTGLVLNLEKKNIITAEQAKGYKYLLFTCGVDTSYSRKTDDKIAFVFSGITTCRKQITLEEEVHNNNQLTKRIAPSDIPPMLERFLKRCRNEWGFAKDVYIDSADQATISECEKYKRNVGSLHSFVSAWKKLPILDRLELENGWLAAEDFLFVEHCKASINERNVYSWKEKKQEPEDRNDHTINANQYGWLPYKDKIGRVQK